MIIINRESKISVEEYLSILNRSTLSQRRPINSHERLATMIRNSNLIICARHKGQLIGMARCITDFAYCCYLSDLAVDTAFQHQGIGKKLISEIEKWVDTEAKVVLLSGPNAERFYPKAGFERHHASFVKQ